MKAVCWHGPNEVGVETVADPSILNPRDAIVRVTLASICGSDLHAYGGHLPGMERGDILGHEFCGRVVATGARVRNLAPGDRVVVGPVIACGGCFFCARRRWSLCDNSNPNAWLAEQAFGHSPAGSFGSSHLFGGYAGGLAELVRVPFADVGAIPIPDGVSDEQAVLAADVLPAGMMAAEMCDIQPGDVVAVFGAGAVGHCAALAASLLGAERVIVVDRVPERLEAALVHLQAETVDFQRSDVVDALKDLTAGRGPDACIDAVGMEARGPGLSGAYERGKQALGIESNRPVALEQAILACRKGGVVSVVGSYTGLAEKVPLGAAMSKGLTLRTALEHGSGAIAALLAAIGDRRADPSYLVTHRLPLDDAAEGFRMFQERANECIKLLFRL
ncbi:MAG TPA: alcohol dehydrogenase catalytic domain-containing protein [Polyangiaceae bacterium]|nr:alcohol dehydrogenase catalytic domain-containing protein [Polyangiaceae bacterium]